MKKITIAATFTLAICSATFAFDFGGLLKNDSAIQTYSDGDFNLDQKNSVSLWARQNFDKSAENYFAVEASYNFEGDLEKEDDKFTNSIDLDFFAANLSKQFDSAKISFTVGRFYLSDLSGIVFTQNADGAGFCVKNNYFVLSTYGAYTGFLNALNTKIISATPDEFVFTGKTPAVQDTSRIFAPDNNKIYDFAEKYAVAEIALSLPNFAANQTVSAEFLGTFRLEKEKYNRMYAAINLGGPVYNAFFYNVSSTLGFLSYERKDEIGGQKTENGISNMTNINLDYYFNRASFGLSGVYASGKQGPLSAFVGFSKNTSTYSLQEFLYSGIIKTGANATCKPLENLLLSANGNLIFNAASGDKKDEDFDKIKYYGFEYSAGATWQVKSDFQLGVTASQFFDKDNSDLAKKTYINLHAALAF